MKFLKTRPGKILVIFINLIVFLILVFGICYYRVSGVVERAGRLAVGYLGNLTFIL